MVHRSALPPSIRRPWWLRMKDSLPWNTAFMALLLCLLVGGYAVLKWRCGGIAELSEHFRQRISIEGTAVPGIAHLISKHGATIDGMIGAYGVRLEAADGTLLLDQPTALNATGFERLPAFAGTLLNHERLLNRINHTAVTIYRDAMLRWRDQQHRRLLIPMSELGGGSSGTLEVPLPTALQEAVPSLSRLDELMRLIAAGDRNTLHLVPVSSAVAPDQAPVVAEIKDIASTWAPRTAPADERIARHLRAQWGQALLPGPTLGDGPANLAQHLAIVLSDVLQRDLRRVIDEDMGIFWLFGWLRWFEVWVWCLFGVLASALYYQGQFLLGWTKRVWTPRGTGHVLLQLFHVPIMSLTVFWIFSYVSSAQAPLDMVRSTPALLAYAFIFGLFPYLAFDLLRKATSQLRENLKFVPEQATTTRSVAVPAAPATPPDRPPHLAELRQRLRRMATAPLE